MESNNYILNKRYKSKINTIAVDCDYEIIKKNKTTCWVKLWENDEPTDIVYKNVKYSVLKLE
jgi:hypothetical protein